MGDDNRHIDLIDRTLGGIVSAWRGLKGSARVALAGAVRPELPDEDAAKLARELRACLAGKGGEVALRARAAELARVYVSLAPEGRRRFFAMLGRDFGPDEAQVNEAIAAWQEAEGPVARRRVERELREALVAARVRLLSQIAALGDGVKFLVDMRAELLEMERGEADLDAVEADLKGLLASWFDVGFLELRRVTWDTPAAVLEKLMAYEAVHAIRSWEALRKRLQSDRRCFAFFHPRMPGEPLIFVEVALTRGLPGKIAPLVDQNAPIVDAEGADTAVFYGISNAQRGLAGIGFGAFLIKRVVDELVRELPNIKVYATLSLVPGLCAWIEERIEAGDEGLLSVAEARALQALTGAEDGLAALRLALASRWWRSRHAAEALRAPLLRLAARYLLEARAEDGLARDPVARFHLSNGARIERVNWLADRSAKGIAHSAGIMVNYRYRLAEIEANHEAYRGEGRIAAVPAVRALLRGWTALSARAAPRREARS